MSLIVGLGNPGLKYAKTRHNLGFRVVKILAGQWHAKLNRRGFASRYTEIKCDSGEAMLLLPQTFMNLSGRAVRQAASHLNIDTEGIIVVHDDLDLPLGAVRVKKGGGAGGHNGLTSVIESLSNNGFIRVRIGIGRPPASMDTADFVLRDFKRGEIKAIDEALITAAAAVTYILDYGADAAMREYNQSSP